jgi:hypothetical protein
MFSVTFDDIQKLGPVIGFLGTIIGLVFAALQVRKNTQIQRARFLVDLANRDLDKDGAWALFFKIEGGHFAISSMESFDESREAVALDALLYHFELVGRLVKMGVLSLAEAEFYKYEINTVLKNAQVLGYLEWSQTRNREKELYPNARSLASNL